jgi:hypothetical protein
MTLLQQSLSYPSIKLLSVLVIAWLKKNNKHSLCAKIPKPISDTTHAVLLICFSEYLANWLINLRENIPK